MRKLLVGLLVVLCLVGMASAAKVGIEVKKDVNDGYVVALPVNLDVQSQLPFLPRAYLDTECVFTAPRGEFTNSMQSLNHSYFEAIIGSEITLLGGKLQLETCLLYTSPSPRD